MTRPKTRFQNYGPYAAGLVVIVLLIWLTPKITKQPRAAFSFKVQDMLMGDKKDVAECYQPCLVSFYDESREAESLSWNMGDSAIRNYPSDRYPEHLYTRPGTYTISLRIAAGRQTNSAQKRLVVKPIPDQMQDTLIENPVFRERLDRFRSR